MPSPESVVQAQVDAYNRHDLEAFVALYAPAVGIFRFPSGEVLIDGRDALRAAYQARFAPGSRVHARVTQRIVQGLIVIDAEIVTGLLPDRDLTATAIYEVRDGLISRAWFVRDWPEEEVRVALGELTAARETPA